MIATEETFLGFLPLNEKDGKWIARYNVMAGPHPIQDKVAEKIRKTYCAVCDNRLKCMVGKPCYNFDYSEVRIAPRPGFAEDYIIHFSAICREFFYNIKHPYSGRAVVGAQTDKLL